MKKKTETHSEVVKEAIRCYYGMRKDIIKDKEEFNHNEVVRAITMELKLSKEDYYDFVMTLVRRNMQKR